MSDQDRLKLQLMVAERQLRRHRRWCAVCRRAHRSHSGLCETGRVLFYALETALALVEAAAAGPEPSPEPLQPPPAV